MMRIGIAADHGGVEFKVQLTAALKAADCAAPVPERGNGRASSALRQQTISEAKKDWRNEGDPH
jgi:hypothetical protein